LRLIKKRSISFILVFMLIAVTFAASGQEVYAAGGDPSDNGTDLAALEPAEEPGLVVVGDEVNGDCGFSGNMIYYTEAQIESVKDSRSVPEAWVIGSGSYVKDRIFSSYHNHGTPEYDYSRVEGLDIETILSNVVKGGINNVNEFSVAASDGYTQTMRISDITGLKYFAPGDTVGVTAPDPTIALYKKSNAYTDQSSGTVPDTSQRLAEGSSVFVFGQTGVQDSNNCKFVQYMNVLSAGDMPSGIGSKSAVLGNYIDTILELGLYKTEYSFLSGSDIITQKVGGVPLSRLIEAKRISNLMPSYTDYRLQAETADGTKRYISASDAGKCFVAWEYTDSTVTPAAQTTACALYMPGTTESDTVLYNVTKINVISQSGQIVTKVAPQGPSVTAASAGYNRIKLSWSASDNATGYYVYRYDTASGSYKLIKDTGTARTYTDTGLATGSSYTYKVRAYTNNRYDTGIKIGGGYSAAKSAKPVLGKGQIKKLYKSGRTSVKVKWSKVSGASGYKIYYGTNKKITKSKKVITIKKGSALSKTVSKLKRGKRYYFKIKAYRTVNGEKQYGAYSAVKSIKR